MELQKAVQQVFLQLTDSLNQLQRDQYNHSCSNLSGNTIGQHVRHIIEMFQCLEEGYEKGEVDYEKRKRDKKIETDKDFATSILKEISRQISRENKSLCLLTYYDELQEKPAKISTNYFREIAYNLEHTIHHMALIRVGLRELGDLSVDDSYGVASSTLKYRKQCAQ
ncbi:MAG TPA: hypothetical protein VHT72_03590 [Puia sp.]|jgi:uncharacterized damage-inducible protein DinB|nr:hypothetical protein [Puia sp.]